MTQDETVMVHLNKYGTITPLEAITRYGITRLAARIYTLKQKGVSIATTIKTHNDKHYASYRLCEPTQLDMLYE